MSLEEMIVRAYAKKNKIPEDQARQILAPLFAKKEKMEELKKLASELGVIGETMRRMPEDAKPIATAMLLKEANSDEDDIKQLIKEIRKAILATKLIDATLKGTEEKEHKPDYRDILIEELRRQNERLLNELNTLKEQLMKTTMEKEREKEKKLFKKLLILLKKRMDTLEKRIEEIAEKASEGKPIPTQEKRDIIQDLKQIQDTINKAKELLEAIGYKVDNKPNPPIMKEQLDIEKTKVDAFNKLVSEHLGPAIADLIRNPEKIADLIRTMTKIRTGATRLAKMTSTTEAPKTTKPVSLDEILKEVEEEEEETEEEILEEVEEENEQENKESS